MATAGLSEVQQVELDWYSENDTVHVTPRDQKRFQIQKDRAIEILQLAKESERVEQQFSLLLDRLAEWVNQHNSRIASAIVTLQDGTLAFVAVQKSPAYDEAFQDDLAELDFEIANDTDLDLIKLKTLALPDVSAEALRSFLDARLVFTYHGKRSGPH